MEDLVLCIFMFCNQAFISIVRHFQGQIKIFFGTQLFNNKKTLVDSVYEVPLISCLNVLYTFSFNKTFKV